MKFNSRIRTFPLILAVVFSGLAPKAGSAAAGDENWDDQFGVPGLRPYGVSVLVVEGPNLYVGGNMEAVGNAGVTNLAKWDGSGWHDVAGRGRAGSCSLR